MKRRCQLEGLRGPCPPNMKTGGAQPPSGTQTITFGPGMQGSKELGGFNPRNAPCNLQNIHIPYSLYYAHFRSDIEDSTYFVPFALSFQKPNCLSRNWNIETPSSQHGWRGFKSEPVGNGDPYAEEHVLSWGLKLKPHTNHKNELRDNISCVHIYCLHFLFSPLPASFFWHNDLC